MTTVSYYDGPGADTDADIAVETDVEKAPAHPASATALSEEIAKLDEEQDKALDAQMPVERERTTSTLGFLRMPLRWTGQHAQMMNSINAVVSARIANDFADLFEIVQEIKKAARRVDLATGELTGEPDYAALLESRKQHWGLLLALNLVEWRQIAARYKGEALASKVIRQEVFSTAYLGAKGKTVEDRTQAGQASSLQQYYFAILCSMLYQHAKDACDSAEILCQRLKDFSAH